MAAKGQILVLLILAVTIGDIVPTALKSPQGADKIKIESIAVQKVETNCEDLYAIDNNNERDPDSMTDDNDQDPDSMTDDIECGRCCLRQGYSFCYMQDHLRNGMTIRFCRCTNNWKEALASSYRAI